MLFSLKRKASKMKGQIERVKIVREVQKEIGLLAEKKRVSGIKGEREREGGERESLKK